MQHTITIGDDAVPIVIRKHSRSKRMVIRYQPIHHQVSLTLPRYVSIKRGLQFVEEKRGWLERQIQEKMQRVLFIDGQVIPVMGKECRICHTTGRGVVRLEEDRLIVPGDPAFMARRVREWLKRALREEIKRLAAEKARLIGREVKKITLRDTVSRWGSCSHDGNLSFSWRLVFAPYGVLDYLVCHEAAHLKHHDHSAAFWALVEGLCPNNRKHQQWLKAHGAGLYLYG